MVKEAALFFQILMSEGAWEVVELGIAIRRINERPDHNVPTCGLQLEFDARDIPCCRRWCIAARTLAEAASGRPIGQRDEVLRA